MKISGWKCEVVEDAYPLTCPACGGAIPNPKISNGDFCYTPVWEINADMECEDTIRKVFNIADPRADFFVCHECSTTFGSLPPVEWVRKWIEEDSKLVSREEAQAILKRMDDKEGNNHQS